MEPLKSQSKLESIFECFLWNSRYCVLLAVIFGLLSSVTLFILGSKEVLMTVHLSIQRNPPIEYHKQVVAGIIGTIDLYLIGIVL
ncbi:MAG: YqhA family protein, partial [Deltaproteobacteria bacterium]|nr:YqhA family protein [Deltaproteobacteria bacterium]